MSALTANLNVLSASRHCNRPQHHKPCQVLSTTLAYWPHEYPCMTYMQPLRITRHHQRSIAVHHAPAPYSLFCTLHSPTLSPQLGLFVCNIPSTHIPHPSLCRERTQEEVTCHMYNLYPLPNLCKYADERSIPTQALAFS